MADRRPLVVVSGQVRELPTADTLPQDSVNGLPASLAAKESAIAAGTTAQYWRGDKTWRDFATDVRATVLTGLATGSSAVIAVTDTVLGGLGKLQAQITALTSSLAAGLSARVAKAGDTMSGDLVINKSNPQINLTKVGSGEFSRISAYSGANPRWAMDLGTAEAESGSGNTGSHFRLFRFSDAGANLDGSNGSFAIGRDTGQTYAYYRLNTPGVSIGQATTSGANGGADIVLTAQPMGTYGAIIESRDTGSRRWTMELGQAGTANFVLSAWNGASFLSSPISIGWSSGDTSIGGNLFVGNIIRAVGRTSRRGVSGAYGGNYHNWYWSGSGVEMWVDTTNIGTVAVTSDERVKRSIRPLPQDALRQSIAEIKPISYRIRRIGIFYDDGRPKLGFSAQNLSTALPESVIGDVDAVNEDGSPRPASVDLNPIVAALVLEVQALGRDLSAALSRIHELEQQLNPAGTA